MAQFPFETAPEKWQNSCSIPPKHLIFCGYRDTLQALSCICDGMQLGLQFFELQYQVLIQRPGLSFGGGCESAHLLLICTTALDANRVL